MTPMHAAYLKVLKSFGNDVKRTMEWFNTPQFELKCKSPNDLIHKNKTKQVIEFINRNF